MQFNIVDQSFVIAAKHVLWRNFRFWLLVHERLIWTFQFYATRRIKFKTYKKDTNCLPSQTQTRGPCIHDLKTWTIALQNAVTKNMFDKNTLRTSYQKYEWFFFQNYLFIPL